MCVFNLRSKKLARQHIVGGKEEMLKETVILNADIRNVPKIDIDNV